MTSFNERYRKPLTKLFKLLSSDDEADLFDPDQTYMDMMYLDGIDSNPESIYNKNKLKGILKRYRSLLGTPDDEPAVKTQTRRSKKTTAKKRQHTKRTTAKKAPCKKELHDFSKCTVASIKQSTSYISIPRGYKANGLTKSKLKKQPLVNFIQKYHKNRDPVKSSTKTSPIITKDITIRNKPNNKKRNPGKSSTKTYPIITKDITSRNKPNKKQNQTKSSTKTYPIISKDITSRNKPNKKQNQTKSSTKTYPITTQDITSRNKPNKKQNQTKYSTKTYPIITKDITSRNKPNKKQNQTKSSTKTYPIISKDITSRNKPNKKQNQTKSSTKTYPITTQDITSRNNPNKKRNPGKSSTTSGGFSSINYEVFCTKFISSLRRAWKGITLDQIRERYKNFQLVMNKWGGLSDQATWEVTWSKVQRALGLQPISYKMSWLVIRGALKAMPRLVSDLVAELEPIKYYIFWRKFKFDLKRVWKTITQAEIRKRYKRFQLVIHPDKCGRSWECCTDPVKWEDTWQKVENALGIKHTPHNLTMTDRGLACKELPNLVRDLMEELPDSNRLSVATLNIFNRWGLGDFQKRLHEQIKRADPDVILFQEASPKPVKLQGYRKIYWDGPGKYEFMGALVRTNSQWRETGVEKHITKSCNTKRHSYYVSFELKENANISLTIGNVHLCGGTFDERVHQQCDDVPDKCDRDIIQTKVEAVDNSLANSASIIVGDFNSDMRHYFTRQPLEKQKKFLKERGWTDRQIHLWNTAPYDRLADNGFVPVPFIEATSHYGGTPDAIWYKGDIMKKLKHDMLDMGAVNKIGPKHGASDHNGIYAEFNVSI